MASLTPDPDLIERADAIDGRRRAVRALALLGAPRPQHPGRRRSTDPARAPGAGVRDRPGSRWSRCCSTTPSRWPRACCGPFQLGYEPAFDGYGYDPERARSLLTAAGWTLGADGIFEKGGRKLEIPIVITAGDELRRTTVRLMADQAARAGIRLTARSEPPDTIFGGAARATGDFTAAMYAFGGGLEPDPSPACWRRIRSPRRGTGSPARTCTGGADPDADRLMRLSDRTIDDATRSRALGRGAGARGRPGPADPALPAAEHRRVHRGPAPA